MKTFFKFLNKNRLYTAINIFGLSVSLMFVILIAAYAIEEYSTDRFHKNADRIYILGNEEHIGSAYRLAARLQERYPEIEKTCTVTYFPEQNATINNTRLNMELLFTDTTFFEVFSFSLTEGNPKQVLAAENSAVISESFARKAFGGRNPIGQSIVLKPELTVTVSGIMKDIKNSSIPYSDIIIRTENVKYFNSSIISETFDNYGSTCIFFLVKEGSNLRAKTTDMAAYLKEIVWVYKDELFNTVTLTPLKEIYFSDYQTYTLIKGEPKLVLVLMIVGIVILIFAIINYINLTVAQTGFRAKEMAIRRLLGSGRKNLIFKLITESTLLCFICFALGAVFAVFLSPYTKGILGKEIDLMALISPISVLLSLLLIVSLGIISGLLPAFILSRVKPIDTVKGGFKRKNKMVFSKFFITFQNTIAIVLITIAIIMYTQVNYLVSAPLGYNKENIISLEPHFQNKEELNEFISQTEQLACVNQIGLGNGTPFDMGNNWTQEYEGKSISFRILDGDSTYFRILGFQKIIENNLADSISYYLSERVLKEMNLPETTVTFKFGGEPQPVAGVIKDIRMFNITRPYDPTVIVVHRNITNPWTIVVEFNGDKDMAFSQVKDTYEGITKLDFTGQFMDKMIESSFKAQLKIAQIVSIFGIIAILISSLGLLAMSTFFIQQRYKEIAIKKVLGAYNHEILINLVKTFLSYVVIAFVIAVPVIWYFMKDWLATYTYKIKLSPFFFIIVGVFCLLVSFITVLWQSWKAANMNPADTIKIE
ncbi:ABC transporter permease [Dysgonomonas macrotermitis]|uniref:Putative ABC transport system permease protein n=1 Tax=Dysgonomonas macrotermitis TaxID=1346286 RepID=A0A1M4Z8E5_9BACT|nr:ABC transporter permease [Dysgonomonas macrotermitis]SHF14265.1 putative ABC transport system permease protein [Dysgonomonas macrotermitis]